MNTQVSAWSFPPKPRSAFKTIERLSALATLEGEDWDAVNDLGERPTRRKYLDLAYHLIQLSDKEPEANARMDMVKFETIGLAYRRLNADGQNCITLTQAANAIMRQENKEELMLRQLLKWQFPNNRQGDMEYRDMRVFPLEVILHLLKQYESLNRLEVAFSAFTCTNINQINKALERVEIFKHLTERQTANRHKAIYIDNFEKINGSTGNDALTYLDYCDALFRFLEYTAIFETSGRGLFTRIYIPQRSKIKFEQLLNKYTFVFFEDYKNTDAFYAYFGNPYEVALPWDSRDSLQQIVASKIDELKENELPAVPVSSLSVSELKSLDSQLNTQILAVNEREFIKFTSKTNVERNKIIEKFMDINQGNEDLAALWMEVNTWKSLVAISGDHFVKRNFKIEVDLTPRSFAGGMGSTPDMELYNSKYIIIPEVSIQSGVQQWITEGSSVIEHVYKFMEVKNGKRFYGIEAVENYMNPLNIESVFGLFITKKLNSRLIWQFYLLARESWIGEPIPVVPIELNQYIEVLQYMYSRDLPVTRFEDLIVNIAQSASQTATYMEWMDRQKELIAQFIRAT